MAAQQVAECGFTLLVQEMVAHYGGEAEAGAEAEGDAAAPAARDYSKLEQMGFQVGVRLAERLTADKPRFGDSLEAVKFVCKDFWTQVFKKQIDNLKTNHKVRPSPLPLSPLLRRWDSSSEAVRTAQGVYVLTDNSFRWTSHISQAPAVPAAGGGSAEAAVEAAAGAERMLAPFVAFPCGVLRGALHNL